MSKEWMCRVCHKLIMNDMCDCTGAAKPKDTHPRPDGGCVASMKTFLAEHNRDGSFGAYDDRWLVVIAETRSVALGLALESEPDTEGQYWTIREINTDVAKAYNITSQSS